MVQPKQDFTEQEITRVLEVISIRQQVNWILLKEILNSPLKATKMLEFLQQKGFMANGEVDVAKIKHYLKNPILTDEKNRHTIQKEGAGRENPKLSQTEIQALIVAICITAIIGILGVLFVFKNTFFRQAIANNHNTIAKIFLKIGADINSCASSDKGSALLQAVDEQEIIAIQTLLDWGANIEEDCETDYTPLMLAVKKGNIDIVRTLLKAGANPNVKKGGNSSLSLAAKNLNVEMLTLLKDSGAEIKNSGALNSALNTHLKSESQLRNTVEYLISQKIDVKENNNTALHSAIRGGKAEIVERLIKAGASVKTNELSLAVQSRNAKIAEMLINAGANVNDNEDSFKKIDYAAPTPLYIAVENKDTEMARVLLKHGAHINIVFPRSYPSRNKVTYLIKAAENNDADMIDLLVKNGAKVNAKSAEGLNAFCMAMQKGHLEAAIALLKHNANFSCVYYEPYYEAQVKAVNPLMIATEKSNIELIKLLLKRGASINEKDDRGCTPLMRAAEEGKMDMVKLLLNNGANAKLTDEDDNNARDYAEKNNHVDIAELLAQKGVRTQKVRQKAREEAQKAREEEFEKYRTKILLCRESYAILHNRLDYHRDVVQEAQKFFLDYNCIQLLGEYARAAAEVEQELFRQKLKANGWLK